MPNLSEFARSFKNLTSQLACFTRSFFFRIYFFAILEIIEDNLKVVKELLRDHVVEAILCELSYTICNNLIIFI